MEISTIDGCLSRVMDICNTYQNGEFAMINEVHCLRLNGKLLNRSFINAEYISMFTERFKKSSYKLNLKKKNLYLFVNYIMSQLHTV